MKLKVHNSAKKFCTPCQAYTDPLFGHALQSYDERGSTHFITAPSGDLHTWKFGHVSRTHGP